MHNRNALRFHRGYSPPPDFDAILREMPTRGPVTVQVTKAAAARAAAVIRKAAAFKSCAVCLAPGICGREGSCWGDKVTKSRAPRPRVTEAALIEKAAGLARRVESIEGRMRPPPAPPPALPEDAPIVKAAKAIAAEHIDKSRGASGKVEPCADCPDAAACKKHDRCMMETRGGAVAGALKARREHATRRGGR